MENFVVALEFFGGLTCLFAICHFIGHSFRLDQYYYADTPKKKVKNENKNDEKETHQEFEK